MDVVSWIVATKFCSLGYLNLRGVTLDLNPFLPLQTMHIHRHQIYLVLSLVVVMSGLKLS